MRNRVIYTGGFRFPDRNASAQRALENARLLGSLGYEVTLLGKLGATLDDLPSPTRIGGFECRDVRKPFANGSWPDYTRSIDSVWSVAEEIGLDTLHSVIAYNYPAVALRALIRKCKRAGIGVVAECTEWYGWEGPNPVRNLRRMFESAYRLRKLTREAGNVICGSTHLQRRIPQLNTIVLPFVVDGNDAKWQADNGARAAAVRQFIYVGSPGLGMSKDLVHLVVEAFGTLARERQDFVFSVVGITREQLLAAFPRLTGTVDRLGASIAFLGRVSHDEAIARLKAADYSVFLRPLNRVSQIGFPTKYVEATSCGVPTITNRTSDIADFLKNGANGFLLEQPGVAELTAVLRTAVSIDEPALDAMKQACRRDNPFHFERYREPMRRFMDRVQTNATRAVA